MSVWHTDSSSLPHMRLNLNHNWFGSATTGNTIKNPDAQIVVIRIEATMTRILPSWRKIYSATMPHDISAQKQKSNFLSDFAAWYTSMRVYSLEAIFCSWSNFNSSLQISPYCPHLSSKWLQFRKLRRTSRHYTVQTLPRRDNETGWRCCNSWQLFAHRVLCHEFFHGSFEQLRKRLAEPGQVSCVGCGCRVECTLDLGNWGHSIRT